jgi:hypothetical protein
LQQFRTAVRPQWAVSLALIEELVLQRLLTPELVPDEVIRANFAALAKYPTKNKHGRLMSQG